MVGKYDFDRHEGAVGVQRNCYALSVFKKTKNILWCCW